MKKYFNNVMAVTYGLLILTLSACQKNESKIYYSGDGTAPVLSATITSSDTIPLLAADSLNTAIAFSWTNPNYQFSSGISSLNVNYSLEIDTVGSNFTNPNIVQIGIASNLGESFTVSDLNFQLFGNLRLQTG